MDDKHVADRIDELARKEHELFELEAKGKASEAQQAELKQIQLKLDQWWICFASAGPAASSARTPTRRRCATRRR